MNWICDHSSVFDHSSAIKECNSIFLTGDLILDYERRLKATDIPSINDILTEVCHKHLYKFLTNNKHPLFSRLTLNHRVSSRRQFHQSRWENHEATEGIFQHQMRHFK